MLAPRQTLLLLAEGDAAKVDAYMQKREESEGAIRATGFWWGVSGCHSTTVVPNADQGLHRSIPLPRILKSGQCV